LDDRAPARASAEDGNLVLAAKRLINLSGKPVGVTQNHEGFDRLPKAENWIGATVFALIQKCFVTSQIRLRGVEGQIEVFHFWWGNVFCLRAKAIPSGCRADRWLGLGLFLFKAANIKSRSFGSRTYA
jgi:hypothetical protein